MKKLKFNFILILCTINVSGQSPDSIQSNQTQAQDTTIYTYLPHMPEFGTDSTSLQKYIVKESKFPATESRVSLANAVFVHILIEKDGDVKFLEIARGANEKFNNEAQRIVEGMPHWSIPRLENGNPARLMMIIPFWFK